MVDKAPTTSRGKFRPFILWAAVPFSISAVLCFATPDLSPTGKLVYASVTYILYGILFTVFEVSYWAMATTFSQNTEKRGILISVARTAQHSAAGLAILAFLPIVNFIGGGNQSKGYFLTAALFGGIALVSFIITYAGTRERIDSPSSGKISLVHVYQVLKTNKPLRIITIVLLIQVFNELSFSGGTYFAAYCLGDMNLFTPLAAIATMGTALGLITVPFLSKIMGGKKKLFIYFALARALFLILFFIVGYENLLTVFVLTGICYFLSGNIAVIATAMYAECIEYNQWHSGERNEGLILSLQSSAWKFIMAISGAALGFLLAQFGYIPNQVQPETVKLAIFTTQTAIIAFGSLLSVIGMAFYPLTEERHREIVLKLEAKHGR